jgi:hypothetical protein
MGGYTVLSAAGIIPKILSILQEQHPAKIQSVSTETTYEELDTVGSAARLGVIMHKRYIGMYKPYQYNLVVGLLITTIVAWGCFVGWIAVRSAVRAIKVKNTYEILANYCV